MKILVVTSKMAEGIVRRIVAQLDVEVDILVIEKPPIAAALTVNIILNELVKRGVGKDYDYIIIPGLTSGDARIIQDKLGVKTIKGPIHASDIPIVVEALKEGKRFSTLKPADEILRTTVKSRLAKAIKFFEEKNKVAISFKELKIYYRGPPVKVVAELPCTNNIASLIEKAERYEEEGADIVIVGSSYNHGTRVYEVVKILNKKLGVPIGVDTNSEYEIRKSIENGASIVFSLDSTLIEKLSDYARNAVYVIIPDEGFTDTDDIVEARFKSLKHNILKAQRLGYDKIIADPVLNPIPLGLYKTLTLTEKVVNELRVPTVFTASNVVEGLEADTHGVIAVLAGLAVELGASLFHVVEDAAYERGIVAEAKLALTATTISKYMETHVRNIGLDMLVLKDRNKHPTSPIESRKTIVVDKKLKPLMDPKGYFKINVLENNIELAYYKYGDEKAQVKFTGTDALSIGRAMLREIKGLREDHILYIGYELAKAEIALKLNKNYIQDEDLFKPIKEKLKQVLGNEN